MERHSMEVREPGRTPRRVHVDGELVAGRETDGLLLDDTEVSRRHLVLHSRGQTLTVADLGSTNGTWVNGVRIDGETTLYTGDRVRTGRTELVVTTGTGAATPAAAPRRTDDLTCIEDDAAAVCFRPGSPGAQAARAVLTQAKRARRALAGLGSEPTGVVPRICLVDPFADPDRPGEVVASGTVVDAARGEVWMVVTAESPPEPLERSLALLFGARLPAAADVELLLEGYGLHLAASPDPDAELRTLALPPLSSAEGELRAAMALSFVRFLLERGTDADLRRLLAVAQPGRLDAAADEVYGAPMAVLEEGWRERVAAGAPTVRIREFLRLALRYLRPYRAREAEMVVYMVLALAFTVVFPFASRRLFDDAIPSGRFSEVLTLLGALGVAFAVSLLAGLRRAYLGAIVSASVVRQVRSDIFSRLQDLSAGWFHRHQQGDVLSRLFSDVGLLETGLSSTVREGSFQVLSLVVAATVLVTLEPLLALVVIATAPLVGVIYRFMGAGAQRRRVVLQEQMGALLQVANENYGAQPVVKAFGLEDRERSRFGRASDRLFQREVRLQLYGGLFGLSIDTVVVAARLGVLALGAWLVLEGRLTVGGLVAFLGIMGEGISPVAMLTNISRQMQGSAGALLRINDILEAVPDVDTPPGAPALPSLSREIRLDGVGFSYTGERPTLAGVDLVIPAGSRVALVGASGSGKSTILQLLMRFYDPDEGAVRFDGHDVRQVALPSLRRQLGVVFQDTFLFDGTIRENIALGRTDATGADIEAAARAAELHDFVAALPRGYDTLVGERGGRLSGGQRQRLAIARALIRDPRVLLLDEATSALDPRTERLIADTLERVSAGRTTVFVTHRLASVVAYDRIFVLADGRLVEQGTHDELVAAGGTYAGLWQEQTGAVVAEAPFDAAGALARVVLFADLEAGPLAEVAAQLGPGRMRPGERRPEGGGLLVLRRGRARVLEPDVAGELVAVAELGPGDAFGAGALLGAGRGAVLEAQGDVEVLVLDDTAVGDLAARFPAVGAVLAGARTTGAPRGGRRLERVTLGLPLGRRGPTAEDQAGPAMSEEIRRATGAFPTMRL